MNQHCPECGQALAAANINIAEGVALCPACGVLSRLSDVVEQDRPNQELLREPPAGCGWSELGGEVVLHASGRSLGTAAGLVFINLFWNGIVSVFVLVALAGLYTNLIGPLPAGFPAPVNDSDGPMSLGATIFLCIFLIPFVTIGSILFVTLLVTLAGRVEVRIREDVGVVRTGIGRLSWTRRFDATRVKRVAIGATTWQQNGQSQAVICIEADRTVKVGSILTSERQQWLRAALHTLLVQPARKPTVQPAALG